MFQSCRLREVTFDRSFPRIGDAVEVDERQMRDSIRLIGHKCRQNRHRPPDTPSAYSEACVPAVAFVSGGKRALNPNQEIAMSSYTPQTPESAAESARPVLEKARSLIEH